MCYIQCMEKRTITIRPSSIQSYNDCARRAVLGIIPELLPIEPKTMPRNIGAVIGTACHHAARHLLEEIASDGCPIIGEAIEVAVESYTEKISGSEVQYDATTRSRTKGIDQVSGILRVFLPELSKIATIENIIAIERRVIADIGDGFDLSGQPDLILKTGVFDWKFGGVSRPAHAQLGAYSLLQRSIGNRLTDGVICHVPRGKETISQTRYDLSIAEKYAYASVKKIIRDIKNYRETENTEIFTANPSSQICTPKYCKAYGTEWCQLTEGK
jgi:hypothetical protein